MATIAIEFGRPVQAVERGKSSGGVPARAGARKARTPVTMVAASFATVGNACVLTLPIRLIGEANAREHHMKRKRRAASQRLDATRALDAYLGDPRWILADEPLDVTMTRLAPARSRFDEGDNEAMCAKHVRDAFAAWIGVNDRSGARVRYLYGQEPNAAYGVRIEIRRRVT